MEAAPVKVQRKPRSYPLNAVMKKKANRTKLFSEHKRRLRSTITPGTVLILLTGRYRGTRVVFLKQLSSGLLLVNGPFKLNKVPMRRVHQNYVIATGTKIDISSIEIPERIEDAYFQKAEKSKTKSDDIFAAKKQEYVLSDERKADQKLIDSAIVKAIKEREDKGVLVKYLRTPFSLSHGDKPHKMTF